MTSQANTVHPVYCCCVEHARFVLVADLKGLSVGQALGHEGQAIGRAYGAVASAFPERMAKTLVVNPPKLFNLV